MLKLIHNQNMISLFKKNEYTFVIFSAWSMMDVFFVFFFFIKATCTQKPKHSEIKLITDKKKTTQKTRETIQQVFKNNLMCTVITKF